jgi:hypothetical protein
MLSLKKGNINLSFRCLLIISHLILFSTQFNGRYYHAANFFIYGNGGTSKGDLSAAASPLQKAQPPVEYRQNSHALSHLSIDKRFKFGNAIKPAFAGHPRRPSFVLIQKKIPAAAPVFSSSSLPTNALRGPPCA